MAEIQTGLAELNARLHELTERWREEKELLGRAKVLKEQLATANTELEVAMQKQEWERAGELQHSVIPQLNADLADLRHTQQQLQHQPMLSEQVSERDIADVVGRATGIPVQRLLAGEQERLLHIEDELRKAVIGQDAALTAVGSCVRRARAGLSSASHPRGSFLFLGPTGVGKTELCKALSAFLFDDATAMTRIDMSEYSEAHSISRLVGAPPGYVGFEEGGTLTEAVRRRPFQVVLMDEFEKAHRKVSNILLQILDEGCLTDSQGRKVDMANTMVVLTSNIGSESIAGLPPGAPSSDAADQVMGAVKTFISAELLNRIDDILLFERLQPQHMPKIVDIQIRRAAQQLAARGLVLEVDDAVRGWLAERAHSPAYGARPLQRLFTKSVMNVVSSALLTGEWTEGDRLVVRMPPPGSADQESDQDQSLRAGSAGAGWQAGGVDAGIVAELHRCDSQSTPACGDRDSDHIAK